MSDGALFFGISYTHSNERAANRGDGQADVWKRAANGNRIGVVRKLNFRYHRDEV